VPVDDVDVHSPAEDVENPSPSMRPRSPERYQPSSEGCRFEIGVVTIALGHCGRADLDGAGPAGHSDCAVVAAQPHLNVRQDTDSRMKMFWVGRVGHGRREEADEAHLTGSISVHDPRPVKVPSVRLLSRLAGIVRGSR
jgi:hypothetical protein